MTDGWRSILQGTAALSLFFVLAVVLAATRPWVKRDPVLIGRFVGLFLIGVAVQCLHLIEEFVTGFYVQFPSFLGLSPWSPEFFVTFNIAWIAIWILAALGLRAGYRSALAPIWFFALGMAANGIAHPILAIASGGYFPGLVTSPVVGLFGVLIVRRLLTMTRAESRHLVPPNDRKEPPSGEADVTLQSMSGDVRLVVPRGFSMDVDTEIAYTKRHAGKHEIKSDLPIERSESDSWDHDHGSARRYLRGQGTIGDGRHRVEIRTVNGDVVIEEE